MKRPSLCRTLPLLGVLVALPLALFLITGALGNRAGRESLSLAEQSIRRAAVQCYALEGAYPRDLSDLEERYGVSVGRERYFVDYRYVASNLMPDRLCTKIIWLLCIMSMP